MLASNRRTTSNGSRSRSITYQSRMSYLKSREGDSGRRLLGKRIIGETSSNSFTTLKPCPAERLLPPMQLMTRERSFRHLYRKYHPPAQIRKMDFFQRKEDPLVKKKREEIYARMRAAELASERLKREKEAWQSRNDRVNGSDVASLQNLSEHSSNEDNSQDGTAIESNMKGGRERGSFVNGVVVSGFVADTKKSDLLSSVASSSNNSGSDDMNDDDTYGESFSFLADWKNESKRGSHKSKQNKTK